MTENARREAWRRMREIGSLPAQLDRLRPLYTEAGLTPGLAKVLAHMPLDRPLPMREMASILRCDNSYVTSVVDVLEEKGIVERRAHPTDRRVKVVVLTSDGDLLAKKLQSELAEPPEPFSRLTSKEAETLRTLLVKLGESSA